MGSRKRRCTAAAGSSSSIKVGIHAADGARELIGVAAGLRFGQVIRQRLAHGRRGEVENAKKGRDAAANRPYRLCHRTPYLLKLGGGERLGISRMEV